MMTFMAIILIVIDVFVDDLNQLKTFTGGAITGVITICILRSKRFMS